MKHTKKAVLEAARGHVRTRGIRAYFRVRYDGPSEAGTHHRVRVLSTRSAFRPFTIGLVDRDLTEAY